MDNKKNYRIIKITAFMILQVMLVSQFAWAAPELSWFVKNLDVDTLSPQIQLDNGLLRDSILSFSLAPKSENSIRNIVSSLKELGFNYADKFSADFTVALNDKYGQAQILLVTADGENAFILRETFETGLGKGIAQRRINLIELNPFTPTTGFEHENGFCRFQINNYDNTASLGLNQEVIVRTNLYQNNGLASAMLCLAIGKAKTLGTEKISVYNVVKQAVSLYGKLGFVATGEKTMTLDLTKAPVANNNGMVSWELQDVAKYRGFRFAVLTQEQQEKPKTNIRAQKTEINIERLKDQILYNDLIQKFFKLDVERKIPWSYLLYEAFEIDPKITKEVIVSVEAKSEAWIAQQGEIIRETHSSRSSYPGADSGGSWDLFINKTGIDTYNLAHLLAHSIGYARNYLDMQEIERARNFLETGYIILRAIDIESRKENNKQIIEDHLIFKKDVEFLPKVKLNKLREDQAFLMIDQLQALFKNIYSDKEISILEDATDIDPNFGFSVDSVEDFKIIFLGRDSPSVYNLPELLLPETYYVAVSDGTKLIGYGYISNGMLGGEHEMVITFRILDPYRHQLERISAKIFKTLLSGGKEIFGKKITRFFLPAHQINGKHGIDSAAIVFYEKLGFKLMETELQSLWERKYAPRVQAGERLNKIEILGLSQSNMVLDLEASDLRPDFHLSDVFALPKSMTRDQPLIEQAI